jgi:hypothetical protein
MKRFHKFFKAIPKKKNSIEPPTGGINPQAYNPAVVIELVLGRRFLEHIYANCPLFDQKPQKIGQKFSADTDVYETFRQNPSDPSVFIPRYFHSSKFFWLLFINISSYRCLCVK